MKKKHRLNSGNTKSIRRPIPHDYVSSLKTIASQPIGSCIATAPVKLRADLRFEWSPLPRVPKSYSQLKQRLTEAPIFRLSISLSNSSSLRQMPVSKDLELSCHRIRHTVTVILGKN